MSDREPVLHVGYHKTASSWFQQEFYPAVTDARHVPRKQVHEEVVRPRGLEFDPDEARAALGGDGDDRLVVCNEELSGNIHTGGRHGFATIVYARRLKAMFPGASVVIVTRELADIVSSAYRQYVRVGGTKSPERYLEGWPFHPRNPSFELGHFAPRRLVRLYEELFGTDRVHVFAYEDFAAEPRAFAETLADRLEVEYAEDDVAWGRRVNRSYGARILPLARLFNLFTRRDVVDKRWLVHLPGWYDLSRGVLRRLNRRPSLRGATDAEAVLGEEAAAALRQRGRSQETPRPDPSDRIPGRSAQASATSGRRLVGSGSVHRSPHFRSQLSGRKRVRPDAW